MSPYHVVMTRRRVIMEFDVFIIISFDPTSTFIVLHPALPPKYVIFVNFAFLRHVQHLLSFLDLEYSSSISA